MEIIEKFIKENKLTFTGTGSALNSDCTILSGFADFKGVTNGLVLCEYVEKARPGTMKGRVDAKKELLRVFEFAYKYNYGNYWKGVEAEKMYKF